MSPNRKLGCPQKITQGWNLIKIISISFRISQDSHLSEFRAEAFGEDVFEEFQSGVLHEVRMRERLVRNVNFVLFGAREPFGEDV